MAGRRVYTEMNDLIANNEETNNGKDDSDIDIDLGENLGADDGDVDSEWEYEYEPPAPKVVIPADEMDAGVSGNVVESDFDKNRIDFQLGRGEPQIQYIHDSVIPKLVVSSAADNVINNVELESENETLIEDSPSSDEDDTFNLLPPSKRPRICSRHVKSRVRTRGGASIANRTSTGASDILDEFCSDDTVIDEQPPVPGTRGVRGRPMGRGRGRGLGNDTGNVLPQIVDGSMMMKWEEVPADTEVILKDFPFLEEEELRYRIPDDPSPCEFFELY